MSNDNFLEQLARGLKKLSPDSDRTTTAIMVVWRLIIIDRSWSMETRCGRINRLEAAKEAMFALLDAREQVGADGQLAVIAFNDQAQLVLPFTPCSGNRERIRYAIRSIKTGGGTNLEAPLIMANRRIPPEGHVHVVMLSDGDGRNPIKAAQKLKERGAIIETIGVGNNPSEVNEDVLKKTASVVDGKVLYRFLADADQIIHYFQTDIANRLVKRG